MSSAPAQYEIVTFSADDPEDPNNWPKWKKRGVVLVLCVTAFCSVFGSSSYAGGEEQIRLSYGVGPLTASSGLTLYVMGFALGPLVWGPVSEMYGRKLAYTVSWPLMIVFSVPTSFVPNIVVILLFRFFTGLAAACALNNGTGVIADMYNRTPLAMGEAISWFILCPLSGPCWGSVVGFFVAAHSSGNQLWVVRVHLFFSIVCWPLVFLLPETYGPAILLKRAKRLRAEGNIHVRAAHEVHGKTPRQILNGHVFRPLVMLITEPVLQGAAIWMSIAYSLIYFFFEMYPQVFIVQHGVDFQLCGLFFIPITLGMVFAVVPYHWSTVFFSRLHIPWLEREQNPVESKLKLVLPACVFMPISLFWFAWTSGPETHWVAAMLSGIPFGYAVMTIFFTFSAYTSETYTLYATSAVASSTFSRSVIGCIFPIVAHPIINHMGTKWGISLFGFLSLGLLPIPLFFIRYGPQLRAKSPLAREAADIIRKMRRNHEDEKPIGLSQVTLDGDGVPKEVPAEHV